MIKSRCFTALPKRNLSMEYDAYDVHNCIKDIASSVKLYWLRLGEYHNTTHEIVLYKKTLKINVNKTQNICNYVKRHLLMNYFTSGIIAFYIWKVKI